MKTILFAAITAGSLAACTSVESLRPDVEARQPPSRLDEIAYINALREALEADPSRQCFNGAGMGYYRPRLSQGRPEHNVEQESAAENPCLRFKFSPRPADIRRYLDAGLGLSDLYCQRYFVVASQARLQRRFGRNVGTAADNLVGTILNLAAAGETAIGIVNAGFGAIDSTFQNMDDSFLVAADLENVRNLVHTAQDAYRQEVLGARMATSYPAARSVIERYAGICSFTGMRRLVNVSVGAQARQIEQNTRTAQGGGAAGGVERAAPVRDARPEGMVPVPPVTPPRQ